MWRKNKGRNRMEDEYYEDKVYKRLKVAAIVLVILAIILGVSFVIGLNLGQSTSNKNVAINKDTVETENKSKKDSSTEEVVSSEETSSVVDNGYNVEDLYYEVHLRVNTIIIAEDNEIWEEIEIDNDFLNNTIPLLKGKDDYLYSELLKWRDLDFSNAVEVHNYVWEKLGGTVGRANALNEEAIQALKEKLAQ